MRRRARWVAAIVAGVVVLPTLIVLDGHRRAGGILDRHRAEVQAAWADLRARSAERPVALGPSEEGNAWDLYREAFAGLTKMTPAEKEAIPEIDGTHEPGRKPDDAAIAAIYRRFEVETELLRRAARRRKVDPDLNLGPELKGLEVTPAFHAARFLVGAMSLHHRQGRDHDAVELGLCGLVLGRDAGRRSFLFGSMVQQALERLALQGFLDLLESHALEASALEDLAGRLDRLVAVRPRWLDAMSWEDVYLRKNLLDYPSWEKAFPLAAEPPRPGWRQLYSDRMLRGQTLNTFSDWLRLVRRCEGSSAPEEVQLLAQATGLAESSGSPLARAILPAMTRAAGMDRATLLQYRLCRLAVALAWFEAERGRWPGSLDELVPRHHPSVPECPLTGTPFRIAPGKVWSVGKDGKDGGGVLDTMRGYDPEGDRGDVVWFVKRK